jgi:hypothetical protein
MVKEKKKGCKCDGFEVVAFYPHRADAFVNYGASSEQQHSPSGRKHHTRMMKKAAAVSTTRTGDRISISISYRFRVPI